MFKRKILKELEEWKKGLAIKRKAFLLKGLRQVGKTYIIKKFANDNYENVVYIDFKKEQHIKECFQDDLSVDTLITNISAKKPDVFFIPFKTVIIFDEIQECSGARASIKSFMEDKRFDVITSGSLLGIKGYNNKYSGGVSVGFEHTVYMKPMDFEEFLMAIGISENVINYLKSSFMNKTELRPSIHESLTKYFKEYICVGGLPSVVNVFVKTHDLNQVRAEQMDIIENYKDDFAKHLDEKEHEIVDKLLLGQINKVFDSLPSQISKENKKFMVSKIDKKSSLEKYSDAIQWLIDYGLVCKCNNLNTLEAPLAGNKNEDVFKLYFTDIGLLIALLDPGTAGEVLLGNLKIYKGAIHENIVASSFYNNNRKLYYFSKNSGLEIDFIQEINNEINLIEVKTNDGRTKSSITVLKDKIKYPEVKKLIRLKNSNISVSNNITTIPLYTTFLI